MKIAIVAPADEKVPPAKYGGTELVINNLAEGLVRRGHDVHLFAAGDSTTSAVLHPTFPKAFRTEVKDSPYPEELRWFYNEVALGKAAAEISRSNFDIVHNHLGWRMLPHAAVMHAPVITTMHGPYDIPFIPEFVEQYPQARFVSISYTQSRLNPGLPFAGTVYNGIDTDKFEFGATPDDYVAFLGRISPDKGIKQAILAAKEANTTIVIAAKVDAVDREYYESEIKPLINGTTVKFIGEVDHAGKVELLKHAKALMMLIQWEEPFGLVMTEALASGTPVIAIPRGSVPEIVEDGKNGFIVPNDIKKAAEAIGKVERIDRAYCRQVSVERFSVDAMVDGYLDVYRRVGAAYKAIHLKEALPLVRSKAGQLLRKGLTA